MLKHVALLSVSLAVAAPAQVNAGENPRSLEDTLGWLIGTWENALPAASESSGGTEISFRWGAGKEVIVWEGSYAAKEATWSFVAVAFFDPVKDRFRVFAFNSSGQRHLGVLKDSEPGRLAWQMSGLRPDGQTERFVLELVQGENGTMIFNMKDRRPVDGDDGGDVSVTLHRTADSTTEHTG